MNKKSLIIKLGFSVLIILCILLIALVGCTKKTTTITTTTTPTVYKLRINDHNPPPTGPAIAVDRWAAYIEEQSGGRIDIEAIHGAALFTGNEIYGQLAQNGCDGGVCRNLILLGGGKDSGLGPDGVDCNCFGDSA